MDVKSIAESAAKKGIKLMGTGDFTHPTYLKELAKTLEPAGSGIYKYADQSGTDTNFILSTEVNNIFEKFGKLRKVHIVILVPDFKDAENINGFLGRYGKLESDGRPTLSLDAEIMVKKIIEICPDAFIVPAHIWTPWFSLFGANFGFDKIEECFGDQTANIFALETGLSSDPPMNWRLSTLDRFALISNSDAHSPATIGREVNCFDCKLDYFEVINVIKNKDRNRFKFTVEFFPQEGKYHWDGHRKCGTRISPEEALAHNNLCPKCGKRITIGVMHRVIELSDREEGTIPENALPCKHLIPLREIIADVLSIGKDSKTVQVEYNKLIYHFGSEFGCLLDISFEDLEETTSRQIAQGITNVREEKVEVIPGYDGVYGEIKIFKEEEKEKKTEQIRLF